MLGDQVLGAEPGWSPTSVRGFIGISGAYDLSRLSEHLHRRGLYRNLFKQIMSIDGQTAYSQLSPLNVVKSWGTSGPAA
jgi:prenylcysteine alpha-carboxyl methylesterase